MSNSPKTGLWLFGVILFSIFVFVFYRILLPEIENLAVPRQEDKSLENNQGGHSTELATGKGKNATKQTANTKGSKEQSTTAAKKEQTANTNQTETQNDDQRYFVPDTTSPYDILKTNPRDKKIRQIASMFGEMKPEQAAKLLEDMQEPIATEVLLKMPSKQAASILDNMDTDKAKKFMEALLKGEKTDTGKVSNK